MSRDRRDLGLVKPDSAPWWLGRGFDVSGLEQLSQTPRHASDLIIPRLRRLFFAGVPERYNSNRLLASPDTAQTPIVAVATARF